MSKVKIRQKSKNVKKIVKICQNFIIYFNVIALVWLEIGVGFGFGVLVRGGENKGWGLVYGSGLGFGCKVGSEIKGWG